MPNKARILIVEDEPEISRFLNAALTAQGYDVDAVENCGLALKRASAHPSDLMILDLGMPDMDGKAVIKSLREWSLMPIIILSARDREEEKVAALDLGADDYITKPFSMAELTARIKVALRHGGRKNRPEEQRYALKDLAVDIARRRVTLKDEELRLTPTEYGLLLALVKRAGQVVTQTELLREVWGKRSGENDHYLRIYIQRLRQKLRDDPLRPQYIFTEPGIGYRLAEEA